MLWVLPLVGTIPQRALPGVMWPRLTVYLKSFMTRLWLLSYWVCHMFNSSGRLKQPDGPVGTVSQVLATRRVGIYRLDLLSIRRLVELLAKW